MRIINWISAAVAMLIAVSAGAQGSNVATIVSKGVATGVIATAASPTKADLFAAEEVRIYLKKITDVDVPLIKGDVPAGKPAIVVGHHPDSARVQAALGKFSADQEAFALVTEGSRLYIVGNGESAVCYGAWQWLEDLGVKWLLPTEKGEYVPKKDTVVISRVKRFDAPAMSNRGPSYFMTPDYGQPPDANTPEHGIDASLLFTARMRLNRNNALFVSDAFVAIGSGHSYMYYLPVDKYFKDHPEWFNMIGGKRTAAPMQAQVCFTNREAAREFAKNIMADIRKMPVKPDRLQVCVSPNDYQAWCECPECLKLAEMDPLGQMKSATSMVVNFANMVAEDVRKEFPTARIVLYAYDNYSKPPTKVMPGPNVCAEVAFWCWGGSMYADHARPMFSDGNSRYRDYFNQYAGMCAEVSCYEYYGHYNVFTPWPKITQMSVDVKEMARNPKFYGMYSESHLHWGTQGPNFYLHPRLMWNPDVNVAAEMDGYYTAGYGPAAPYIKAYFDVLQKRMDSAPRTGGITFDTSRMLTPDVVRECDRLIDHAAAQMANMDANTKWRTDLVVQGWRYSAKTAEALRLYMSPTGNRRADRAVILRDLRQLVRFANTQQGRWVFENRIVMPQVNGLMAALGIDLNELPVGEHTYSDPLWFGGAIKFLSEVRGLTRDTYSFRLAPNVPASIEIPFRAVDGHKISSLSVNIGWYLDDLGDSNLLKARVSVLEPGGKEIVIAPDLRSATGDMVIPSSLLGPEVRVKVRCENVSTIDCPVMTSFGARITVQ